jgi:hypothetical protein
MNEAATALVETQSFGMTSVMSDDQLFNRMYRMAEVMATSKMTVPKHLQNSAGDCMAIVMQSSQWKMNPFAVAQKTHVINGVLGYEAQLISAVINSSGAVKDRFHFEWFGDWSKVIGNFKEVLSKSKVNDDGTPKKYIVPNWNLADEKGIGVKVWATLKGEDDPRILELFMSQATVRNSTLWATDPKQQLAYLAQKRWARLFAPDVILGVYSADELEEPTIKDITPQATATVHDNEPKPYPQADYEKNKATWKKAVESGKKAPNALIATIETKGYLTNEQKLEIASWQPIEAAYTVQTEAKGESVDMTTGEIQDGQGQ